MERWVLAVGNDLKQFNEAQQEWLEYGLFMHLVTSLQEAIKELMNNKKYLLVAIFSNQYDYLPSLKIIRELTKAPIIVITHQYDGGEKIAAIDAGADEYIQCPDTICECIASARALIRRYTELNQVQASPLNIVLRGDVFISLDYRKVFIHAKEIELPRREFDLFLLLVSNPDRVFSSEQLYQLVWGDEYVPTEYGLYSCVRRIRSKLKAIPETSCNIVNKRGVGYSFSQKTT